MTTEAETLAEAERAFERGDFAAVRALTAGLTTSLDSEVRKKAHAMRARVSFDPLSLGIYLVAVAFFLLVCVRYLGGGDGH